MSEKVADAQLQISCPKCASIVTVDTYHQDDGVVATVAKNLGVEAYSFGGTAFCETCKLLVLVSLTVTAHESPAGLDGLFEESAL